jgi:hypothetical protein
MFKNIYKLVKYVKYLIIQKFIRICKNFISHIFTYHHFNRNDLNHEHLSNLKYLVLIKICIYIQIRSLVISLLLMNNNYLNLILMKENTNRTQTQLKFRKTRVDEVG